MPISGFAHFVLHLLDAVVPGLPRSIRPHLSHLRPQSPDAGNVEGILIIEFLGLQLHVKLIWSRSALMVGLIFSSPSSFRLGSPNCQVLQAAKVPKQKKINVSCTYLHAGGVLELFIEGFQHHLHLVLRR